MTAARAYLVLCVAGTALPLSQAVPFLAEHGLNVSLFIEQLLASPVSRFFAADVVVSAAVLCLFVLVDGSRAAVRHTWMPLIATFAVGVSLGLPLFLYMREAHVSRAPRHAPAAGAHH
jgi:hypothetical protein